MAASASSMTMTTILLVLVLMATTPAAAAAAKPKPKRFPVQAHPTKSGYLSVKDERGNSLYYAFYEATDPVVTADPTPLLVWLQGGPGCSSLLGNFEEIGPYVLHCTFLAHNPFRWNRRFGVVFIDNPLGSGFSVPVPGTELHTNQSTIAAHLLAALQSFMHLDKGFHDRPLFLAGESYAGKYIPAAARHILEANARLPVDQKLNLQGIAIGNGMTDPVEQITVHANQAYFAGLINANQKEEMEKMQDDTVKLVNKEDWQGARAKRNEIFDFLKKATGVATSFNYARDEPYPLSPLVDLVNNTKVKKALRVRKAADMEKKWVRCNTTVTDLLGDDIMKSVRGDVDFVLMGRDPAGAATRVRVLLFQGVYDLHLGPASVEAWVRKLSWMGLPEYLNAPRKVWRPWGDVVAGHVQAWGPLTNVVIPGAGHMAAGDKREAAQAMIEGWVLKKGPFADGAPANGKAETY